MASDLKEAGGRTRLHVTAALEPGAVIALDKAQSHYLLNVLRARARQRVLLFNGHDGEWQAEITDLGKRAVTLSLLEQTLPQAFVPDLWLIFAPVKKTPSDYLVQKATELGVSRLQPVFTHRTIVARVNEERLLANAVEAAEQSGRLSVPEIGAPVRLDKLLETWSGNRRIFFCDEGGDAGPLSAAARGGPQAPAAILTGPEGGFAPEERARLRALPFVTPVNLGPRILRADTAALAALAIWQAFRGDWA